jgi:hypothetical protein
VSLEKHKRVCKKVFKTKTREFNVSKQRMNDPEMQVIQMDEKDKNDKWREESRG